MEMKVVKPRWEPGGHLDLRFPGGTYHVRGRRPGDGSELANTVFLNQVHGSSVIVNPAGGEDGDGMIITGPGRYPGIRTADCLPVFMVAEGCTAAFHAGWRGLALDIPAKVLKMMPRQPEMVIMGNCICSRCYEVGWDVRNAVAGENAEKHPEGRLDLKLAALKLLHRAGLPMEVPVVSVQGCTKCRNELFHSHRRDGTDERNLQWFSPN